MNAILLAIGEIILCVVFWHMGYTQGRESERHDWEYWRSHFPKDSFYIDGVLTDDPKYMIIQEDHA